MDPLPEVEGIRDLAGAYGGATARLATAKQRLLAFLAKRGFVYGGTTPAGNPRKYWTYDFLRWLDKVRPEDDGGVRTLAALRNEVEAAAEARADLLSEYRAAVDASPIAAEAAALQSIKGTPSRWPRPSRPRSATSRGSVPEGRSRPISASRRVRGRVATPCGSEASAVRATRS